MIRTDEANTLVKIQGPDYEVVCDHEAATVRFHGRLRLRGVTEYAPIVYLLNELAEQKTASITLDVRELQFLNSSGLDMLLKFIIRVRKLKASQVTLFLAERYPWQQKSLKNLQRLMPSMTLEIE